MTVATFCSSGQAERVKGAVHGAAGAIVGAMALYNAVAWWYRRERHLGINAALYAAGFAWELYQTNRHLQRRPAPVIAMTPPPAPVEACECGDGFCWCGGAESEASTLRRVG